MRCSRQSRDVYCDELKVMCVDLCVLFYDELYRIFGFLSVFPGLEEGKGCGFKFTSCLEDRNEVRVIYATWCDYVGSK